MQKKNLGTLWLLGAGAVLALSHGVNAQAAVIASGVTCPVGTVESTAPEYVLNGDFSTLSGQSTAVVGNAIPSVQFSSDVDYAGDRVYPNDTQIAIQNNQEPSINALMSNIYQVPITAVSHRNLAATDRWLLANGNSTAGRYTVWRQTINNLDPNTNYLFSFYVSNALRLDYNAAYGTNYSNLPRPGARIQGGANLINPLALTNETSASGDNWQQLAGVLGTLAGQTSVTLEIFNDSAGGDASENGDMLGIAHITLRRCVTVPDSDGDGIRDHVDEDDDNDGIPDCEEGCGVDSDSDGVPNRLDLDSDNDGIYDLTESGHYYKTLDPDNDGRLSGQMGSNGILDSIETTPDSGTVRYDNATPNTKPKDTDNDAQPDYLDLNTDGDGVMDVVEGGGQDNNNDGRSDSTSSPGVNGNGIGSGTTGNPPDSDNDGMPDWRDPNTQNPTTPNPPTGPDNDGDGQRDSVDLDDDNDGIPDSFEGNNADQDNDGIPNRLDLDSDNDGVADLAESGHPYRVYDNNGDGRIDRPMGSNGLADVVETHADSGEAVFSIAQPSSRPLDTDGDNVPDFLDVDSDNDSLTDAEESGVGKDANEDGKQDSSDSGVNSNGAPTDFTIDPRDTDRDGLPDLRDPDSDNDGKDDIVETENPDTDDNGQVDNPEDNNGDGMPDNKDINNTPVDRDGNGVQDQLEPSSSPLLQTGLQGAGGGGALTGFGLLGLALAGIGFARRRFKY